MKAIFTNSGLEVRTYRYYDAANSSLEFENTIKDMKEIPEGSCVLLHACAHNVSDLYSADGFVIQKVCFILLS